MASNNPHKGHRERLRSQIKARGLDGLPEHNVLEYLLFPLIPQRDTNGLAHRLIGEFGSSSGVLDAGYEQLRTVQGMTDNAALFLSCLPDCLRLYGEGCRRQDRVFKNSEEMGEYLKQQLQGRSDETLICLFLDLKYQMIDCRVISEGVPSMINFPMAKIAQLAVRLGASIVTIAHNHPRGLAIPSVADRETTSRLRETLARIGIDLYDHIIVGIDDEFVSMRASNYFIK